MSLNFLKHAQSKSFIPKHNALTPHVHKNSLFKKPLRLVATFKERVRKYLFKECYSVAHNNCFIIEY